MKRDSAESLATKVEALGDVLSAIARSGTRPDSLKRGLANLVIIVTRLVDLRETEPEVYDELVVPAKFRKLAERDAHEVSFRAWLAPDIVFAGFQAPLDQFERIFAAGAQAGNADASSGVARAIKDVLERMAAGPDNEFAIKMGLRTTTRLTQEALRTESRAAALTAWNWFDVVVLLHPFASYRTFRIEYLEEFATTLWNNSRLVISSGSADLFASLVDSLVTTGGNEFSRVLRDSAPDLFEFSPRPRSVDGPLREWIKAADALERGRRGIESVESLREWDARVVSHCAAAHGLIADESIPAFQKAAEDWRRSAETYLKCKYVVGVLFSCGSYLVFRGEYDRLPLLLDYAQPPDADVSWIGWNPFARDLQSVLTSYVLPLNDRDTYRFWEARHGRALYDEEFVLVLILRAIASAKGGSSVSIGERTKGDAPDASEDAPSEYRVVLREMTIQQVFSLKGTTDRLRKAVSRLAVKTELLSAVGIPSRDQERLLRVTLPAYLDAVDEASDRETRLRIVSGEISSSKLTAFADNVQSGFLKNSRFRELLLQTGNLVQAPASSKSEDRLFGVNTLFPRNAFLEIPYEIWTYSEERLGEDIARGVEVSLVEQMAAGCAPFSGGLDEALAKLDASSPIIITSRTWDPESLIDMARFTGAPPDDESMLPGQVGWYQMPEAVPIPVLENFHLRSLGTIVTDLETLGTLVESDPVPDDCGRLELRPPLAICVREISEDEELAKRILSDKPEWLVETSSVAEPSEGLRLRVWLRILTSYKYTPAEDAGLLLVHDVEAADAAENG